jgi:two-component system, chemotaxis family, CheB/CheR fusion protein
MKRPDPIFIDAAELQARLAAIVESSDDAIASKDLNGIVTSWNQAAERIFGYTAEEMIGQPIALLVPPERPDEEPQILARIRQGERIDHYETVRVRKDGRRIDVSVTISPLRDPTGEIVGASKIARDITERKRLQAELQERNEQIHAQNEELEVQNEELAAQNQELMEADRLKNEFLAMLAHELRNPLAPVLNAVHLLRARGSADPLLQRPVEVIGRQIRHMAHLLDGLLDVSRITRGMVELWKETLDLTILVGSAVQDLEDYIEERGHQLSLDLPTSPVLVDGDPVRLAQIVTNLVNNAAKFTEPGGSITLSLTRSGDEAVLTVRDTGVGIKPELLSRVFDLFRQADQGLARAQGGLGVGLTVVRNLVEMHAGTVEARSEGPGCGSEFIVRLPISPVEKRLPGESASLRSGMAAQVLGSR